MNENNFGKGAIKKRFDIRDHKIEGLGMTILPFDWEQGFDIEAKSHLQFSAKNQGQSSSCGGQAAAYYEQFLEYLRTKTFEERSAKFIYSQIAYPGGGTTIRDIGKHIAQKGVCSELIVPSYEFGKPPSEWFMTDKSKNTKEAYADAQLGRQTGYALISNVTINNVASAIRDNNGAIIMVSGENNGTWLSKFPKPPTNVEWHHFVYAGKALTLNGKKYIGIKNSWGDVGENGWQYIGEEYFTTGNIRDCLVFYDKTLYEYTPTATQKALTPIQVFFERFLNWFYDYWQK